MGAARKLQSEIDRCLKKVQEGIDEFDQIWQKVHDTENANQKEKYEADLKKEIKKLQRLRDQIKSWISGADIKDKTSLMDARRSIEREMERFKTCEKEAKMKQFSKAALGQADRLDPREQAKAETADWINDMVDRLQVAIEQHECDIEELSAGLKKKAKPPPKLVQLEEVVTVHKKHVIALEKALRCLDNDALASEELDPLKDDLEYYLGMELSEHYDNTDDLYCDIAERLDAVEAAAPAASLAGHMSGLSVGGGGGGGAGGGKAGGKDAKARSGGGGKDDEEREKERAAAAAVKAQLIAQGNQNVKPLDEGDKAAGASSSLRPAAGGSGALHSAGSGSLLHPASPLSSAASGSLAVPPSPRLGGAAAAGPPATPTPRGQKSDEGPLSPSAAALRSAAAAAAAAAASPGDQAQANGQASAAAGSSPQQQQPASSPAPAAARPGVTLAALVGGAAAREQQQQPATAPTPTTATPAGGRLGAWMAGGPDAGNSKPAAAPGQLPAAAGAAAAGQQQQQTASAVLSKGLAAAKAAAAAGQQQQQQAAAAAAAAAAAGSAAADAAAAAAAAAGGAPALPEGASGADLLAAWCRVAAAELGLGGGMFGPVPRSVPALPVLEAVMRSALPQPSDSDWNKPKPRHPIVGPTSYPKSQPDVISAPGLFRKMDPEALFFAFYYQPDTYQQYLAAQELKRQSWRYHKQHNAWFQRYAEPSVTNDEYEQGTYVYFDYHVVHDDLQTGWCYRRKENFVFRYDALEDELPVSQL